MTGKCGVWLVGGRGGVAVTTLVGLCALKRGLVGDAGLVSQMREFRHLDMAGWDSLVVGGHEIRPVRMVDEAMKLVNQSRAIEESLVAGCRTELEEIDARIRPGTIYRVGPTISRFAGPQVPTGESPREAIARLQNDMAEFAQAAHVDHLIVVNIASTEPLTALDRIPATWAELDRLLDRADECALPASSLYAIAALARGWSYINFTPSLGSRPDAIDELARLHNTRHMGCDGKTGETLLKSVLAPMFRRRNLPVMSWVGHNIFGNADAVVLDDPANKQAKDFSSKDHLLREIFGYQPQTLVSIEYVESLGDWKTAWDHIHFKGFLGTPMTLQFIWQGCDSLLAAPLVLDLIRFTELAYRRGEVGRLTFLASFFKSPYGVDEHDFTRQFQLLESWAAAKQ